MAVVLEVIPYGSQGTDAFRPLPRAGETCRRRQSHKKETKAVKKESGTPPGPRHIRASSKREPKKPLGKRLRVWKVNGFTLNRTAAVETLKTRCGRLSSLGLTR